MSRFLDDILDNSQFLSALFFSLRIWAALACFRFDSLPKRDNIRNLPKPIAYASGHRRRRPQLRMYLDEVVIHHVKRDRMDVVLDRATVS